MREERGPHQCCRWDPGWGCSCLCCPALFSHNFRALHCSVTNLPTGHSWTPKMAADTPRVYSWSADKACTSSLTEVKSLPSSSPKRPLAQPRWSLLPSPRCSEGLQNHLPCTNTSIHFFFPQKNKKFSSTCLKARSLHNERVKMPPVPGNAVLFCND